jgi:dsDNA-specific endonuclease/ATPase MutS2
LNPSSRPENIIGQALQDEQKNLEELTAKINSIKQLRLATEEDYKKIDTFNKETEVLKKEIIHLQAQPHLDENSQHKLNEMQELLEQKVTKHDKEIDRVVFPLKEIQERGLLSLDYLIIAQDYPYVVLSVSSFEYSLRETLKEIQSEQGSDAVTFSNKSLTDEIQQVSARINELQKQQDVFQTHGVPVVISIGASGITPWVAAACAKNSEKSTVLQSESQFYDFYKNFCAKSN